MFQAVFAHHQELIKTVFAALGIVMLFCCLPLVWMGSTSGRQQESMTIPKAAHTAFISS